ncbi:hypothetical protein M0805_006911 [Coniferiporia weirii]|nr:hypothetical protein M0805_006911 [Coniferiporia weirii]
MGDGKFQKRLAKELRIWCRLDHPNVHPFLGFFFVRNGDKTYPSLVSMWMENGTISAYLDLHPDCDLKQMILGITEGIEYLHENNIVHSDIKPENILISPLGEPRICDFGISRMLSMSKDSEGSSTAGGLKGTVRFTSIELLNTGSDQELNVHSKASDIWAFGMTVLVLLTKKRPYSHLSNDIQVIVAIMHGELPPIPEDYETWPGLHKDLWKLCSRCWNSDPLKRPSMSDISSDLKSLSDHVEGSDTEAIDHDDSCASFKEGSVDLTNVSDVAP